MRKTLTPQYQLGQVDISEIEFDLSSRDEIPKILLGLQHIYTTDPLRKKVFGILDNLIPEEIDRTQGCPGMDLWRILVLGTLRLICNIDYDHLRELANNHLTLRQMLGHSFMDTHHYALQTLKDNILLFTPEILDELNQWVVLSGHELMNKKEEGLKGHCDSFVVETDVHFPTDINLLFDAIRKAISLVAQLCESLGLSDWRQFKHHIKKIKKAHRKIQKIKRSRGQNRDERLEQAYRDYLLIVRSFIQKIEKTANHISNEFDLSDSLVCRLQTIALYLDYTRHQINLTHRRVIEGETIPHCEKIHSIFEPHTEWISKGKANAPVELGVRVVVIEDPFQFILHHRVMSHQSDSQVAVEFVRETKERFEQLQSCSFDKGFWSPENDEALSEILDVTILPKKGRLSPAQEERENGEEFLQGRKHHPAIESAIHGLENHGLDICPDHGMDGFKRYVGLGVLAYNLHNLGRLIQKKKIKEKDSLKKAA